MALSPYGDLKFGDKAGMRAWMQRHSLKHSSYNRAVLRKGQVPPGLPLADKFGKEWLLAHQAHHKMLNHFFVPGTTNLFNLTVDPTSSEVQFYAWMRAHNRMHVRIDQKFNAVVKT